MTESFEPTRLAALSRLSAFVPKAGYTYTSRRNYDLGAGHHTDVSCLSPYLRCRLITEEEVLESVLARHSFQASEKFVQEVFWRTYWKGWLEMRPGVWQQYLAGLAQAWNAVQTQSGLRHRWEEACTGRTGIDCFDVWARELVTTGYLHNHARMWFASIWVFTLELPWELGADFFLRHLLDGDPASNTLGWRWVAGIQTPGKTYLARTSNISKYTEGRFHPKWQLATDAPAVSAHAPPAAQPVAPLQPIDPALRTGFLWHDDDLSPSFMLREVEPVATACLVPQISVGPLHPAPHVERFRALAQQDAISRYEDRMPEPAPVSSASDIVAWATAQGLQQIVTPYATVGPTADILSEIDRLSDGLVLRRCLRPYDERAWPHATRGFFPFKKQIPALLDALGHARAA